MQKSCFIMIKVMFYHQQKREFRIEVYKIQDKQSTKELERDSDVL